MEYLSFNTIQRLLTSWSSFSWRDDDADEKEYRFGTFSSNTREESITNENNFINYLTIPEKERTRKTKMIPHHGGAAKSKIFKGNSKKEGGWGGHHPTISFMNNIGRA